MQSDVIPELIVFFVTMSVSIYVRTSQSSTTATLTYKCVYVVVAATGTRSSAKTCVHQSSPSDMHLFWCPSNRLHMYYYTYLNDVTINNSSNNNNDKLRSGITDGLSLTIKHLHIHLYFKTTQYLWINALLEYYRQL